VKSSRLTAARRPQRPGAPAAAGTKAGRARVLGAVGFATLACLTAAGCLGYRRGSLMHPQIKTVAVGEFTNRTPDADLGVLLRRHLAEHFMTDGSLTLVTRDRADAVVRGRIVNCRSQAVGSSRRRPAQARDSDSDTYQPAIVRIELEVEYELIQPSTGRTLGRKRSVEGTADFSQLPDIHVARQLGIRQAASAAAQKMVAAITEAW